MTAARRGIRKGEPQRFIAGHHLAAVHGSLRRPDNTARCACGCGEPVNPRNRAARYAKGHQLAEARAARHRKPVTEPQPCACGCGTLVRRRYVSGHNSFGMKRGEGRYVNNQGYVMLRMPDHPRANKGYVLEHRWVMEEAIGRPLLPTEVVHHRNHVKTDNRRDNLVLLAQHDHGKEHGRPVGRPVSAARRAQISADMKRVWAERRAKALHGAIVAASGMP